MRRLDEVLRNLFADLLGRIPRRPFAECLLGVKGCPHDSNPCHKQGKHLGSSIHIRSPLLGFVYAHMYLSPLSTSWLRLQAPLLCWDVKKITVPSGSVIETPRRSLCA